MKRCRGDFIRAHLLFSPLLFPFSILSGHRSCLEARLSIGQQELGIRYLLWFRGRNAVNASGIVNASSAGAKGVRSICNTWIQSDQPF